MAENRTEPTFVRKKMTSTLAPEAPISFSRSDRTRPPTARGASPRTKKRYTHAAPMPVKTRGAAMRGGGGGGLAGARAGEDKQRGWVGQHAHHQHREYPYQVVDLEVVHVLAHAGGGLARAGRVRAVRAPTQFAARARGTHLCEALRP